jgi:phenol 2-monooxygenase/3-hydroxybenzoate 4-monooxygenase
MQFYLDGVRGRDPYLDEASEHAKVHPHTDTVPGEVDVLIVGCGPAGLTLAAQLAVFPDITTAIVEQKEAPLHLGQADGIACRTMEMFQAFGFADRVQKEACWINEVTFWKPDEKQPENIMRHGRVQDTEEGLSEFPHVVLNQARVHDFYLETMRNSPSRLEPHYARKLLDVAVDAKAKDYPVTVRMERMNSEDASKVGQVETVKARYVVGCDGARSAVRKSIGRELVGDAANQAWGVMDVLAVTDFPDIRHKVAIQSANGGNLLIIPREGGYLVRLYVEMDKLGEDERVANRKITVDKLIAAAQRILHPYTLDVKEVAWWSVYEIGHRICDKYDDVVDVTTQLPRVFIAGDACHTHSPKAGQGMNFSMQDSFNLGWKLAAVLRGQCPPQLLHSYSAERQSVGHQLITFDREWARMISDKPADGAGDSGGVDPKAFQKYFEQHLRFTAGMGTQYSPSVICGESAQQALATGFEVGRRFHSAPVLRVTDAKPLHLGHVHQADGRWRLYAFAGKNDHADAKAGVHALCQFLQESPDSPVRQYTRPGQDVDAVFDLRAIFQQSHHELAIETMPVLLRPQKGRYGLRDYEKVFCPDLKKGPDIFDLRGVNREKGALVVVRPDQYIAQVLPLDAHQALAAFFAGFMLPNA